MDNPTGSANDFSAAIEALKDLPVASIVPDILKSVGENKVTIVTAETGSGKTLLANAALADASDHPVWVLVPRRFLAINAAKAVADLSGSEVGDKVGYAIGRKTTDRSKFSPDTKLIFATYGYALSSGLLDDPNTKTIVCDEVHEAGVDTSLARAIIHKRMQTDKDLHVVEMSATINAERQAEYWQDIRGPEGTAIHHAEGKAYECEYRHVTPPVPSEEAGESGTREKADAVKEAVNKLFLETTRDLLKEVDATEYTNVAEDNKAKGIAVFVEGVKIAENTAAQLRQEFAKAGMMNVEVATIYADMDAEQREKALAAPAEGNLKVIVGTNVIESGMNIKWLRGGISNGKTKIPHYYTDNGAEELKTEELPEWRIKQQIGRVNRFDKGKFILFSATEKGDRPLENTPEITRVSLTNLVMYAANYGIDPTQLTFDVPVSRESLEAAKEDLKRLQLLNDNWTLTEQGKFVIGLPLGPEAGAMMWAAKDRFPNIMNDAIELVAVAEVTESKTMAPIVPVAPPLVADEAKSSGKASGKKADKKAEKKAGKQQKSGGIRADVRVGQGEDNTSDVFDSLKAYKKVVKSIDEAMKYWCELSDVDPEQYKRLRTPGHEPKAGADGGISSHIFADLVERERKVVEDCCAEKNVSVMRYREVKELISDLHRRLGEELSGKNEPAKNEQLTQIMLHGSVNRIFEKYVGKEHNFATGKDENVTLYKDLMRMTDGHKEDKYTVAGGGRSDERFTIAHLREVENPRTKVTTVYAGNLTRISKEALLDFVALRPDVLTNKHLDYDNNKFQVTGNYFGGAEVTLNIPKKPEPHVAALINGFNNKGEWVGHKPKGKGNTGAIDDTQELGEERRKQGSRQ